MVTPSGPRAGEPGSRRTRISNRRASSGGRRHTDDPDEEIAEIAEEHQERRDAGERPPRGKL
jgi:hypothetical protein